MMMISSSAVLGGLWLPSQQPSIADDPQLLTSNYVSLTSRKIRDYMVLILITLHPCKKLGSFHIMHLHIRIISIYLKKYLTDLREFSLK
jgi:hypothetical protein